MARKHSTSSTHLTSEQRERERERPLRGTFHAGAVATLCGPARQKHSSMVLSDTPISLSLAAIHGSTGVKSLMLFALRARSPAHCALQQISVLNTAPVLSLVLALCPAHRTTTFTTPLHATPLYSQEFIVPVPSSRCTPWPASYSWYNTPCKVSCPLGLPTRYLRIPWQVKQHIA